MPLTNVLALDIGEKRVGLALARADVRVPVILPTLERQADNFWEKLLNIIDEHEIEALVIGLPRGLEGQETAQTRAARVFAAELYKHSQLPVHWQDEALTSVKAEETLSLDGQTYQKADVDALAASYILADYLDTESMTQ